MWNTFLILFANMWDVLSGGDLSVTSMTFIFFELQTFLSTRLTRLIFYVLLQNLYHISILPIAGISSKMGSH